MAYCDIRPYHHLRESYHYSLISIAIMLVSFSFSNRPTDQVLAHATRSIIEMEFEWVDMVHDNYLEARSVYMLL